MATKNEDTRIVKNESEAYGYNYASLGDITKQGFRIPKMKTGEENNRQYVYYFDTDLNEWIRGAEIVVPDQKGMNIAQKYGSALTYARRYTTLMALSLACDDDKKLEAQAPEKPQPPVSLGALVNEFRQLYTEEEQLRILNGLHLTKVQDIGTNDLQKYVNYKRNVKKQSNDH